MYSRIGAPAYKKDLGNTLQMCELLNHPEKKLTCIHVAGTNGKGSTSHMLAAILQQQGYKTGLYTSPHLKDFRERIRINGKMINEDYVVNFVRLHDEKFKPIQPSFFEWTVALCFQYFVDEEVDIAVIETGLGGRLDSTNVIQPILSVITNISNDHSDLLGDSIEKIAFEKAGIIKENTPVVIGESQMETENVFIEFASQKKSAIVFADKFWNAKKMSSEIEFQQIEITDHFNIHRSIELDLTGDYQLKNCCTVLESCSQLNKLGIEINQTSIVEALRKVKSLTGLQGRWEILNKNPLTIADVAHNEGGIAETMKQLKDKCKGNLHFVIGFVNDKKLNSILSLFPANGKYYFCKPAIPRGLDEKLLLQKAETFGLFGESFSSVQQAFIEAKKSAKNDDCIYVGGSNFVVAELL